MRKNSENRHNGSCPRRVMAAVLLLLLAFIVQACMSEIKPAVVENSPDIPARIADQQKQIDRGEALMEFSPNAARKLRAGLDPIRSRYSQLEAGGGLTPKEIKALNRMLNESSDAIAKARLLHKKLSE